MMTALGKLADIFLKWWFILISLVCAEGVNPGSFCRATFDRIAEININIDAGHDSVSWF